MRQTQRIFTKSHRAFSLVELSIALLIIGLIIGSVLKGSYLIESAKIQSVVRQFHEIRNNLDQYMHRFGVWPGLEATNDNEESKTGYWNNEDNNLAWTKLGKSEIISYDISPKSKLGGKFYLESFQHNGLTVHCITLCEKFKGRGILTEQQVQSIKHGLTGNESKKNDEGEVIVRKDGNSTTKAAYKISYQFIG